MLLYVTRLTFILDCSLSNDSCSVVHPFPPPALLHLSLVGAGMGSLFPVSHTSIDYLGLLCQCPFPMMLDPQPIPHTLKSLYASLYVILILTPQPRELMCIRDLGNCNHPVIPRMYFSAACPSRSPRLQSSSLSRTSVSYFSQDWYCMVMEM